MHHPDICEILLTIDDYFILLDSNLKCEIEPYIDESDEDEPQRGVTIRRKLLNGYIEAKICGIGEDDDTVIFNYISNFESLKLVKSIEIECSDYSVNEVRSAVRTILRIDKESSQHT
jgi:hypothetical protein